ncbi:hypothetical protein pb186bvf_001667 [Paramecium bursaria]
MIIIKTLFLMILASYRLQCPHFRCGLCNGLIGQQFLQEYQTIIKQQEQTEICLLVNLKKETKLPLYCFYNQMKQINVQAELNEQIWEEKEGLILQQMISLINIINFMKYVSYYFTKFQNRNSSTQL